MADFLHASMTGPVEPAATAPTPAAWRLDGATAFDAGLVLLFVAALWASRRFDARAGLFPWTIASVSLLLAIVNVAVGLRARRGPTADGGDAAAEPPDLARRTAAICGWIVGMYAGIWLLG